MRYLALILTFIAMLCVADVAQAYPLTVNANDHPRLLFNYNEIDQIRANIQDPTHPFHDLFAGLKADAQGDLDDNKLSSYYQPKYVLTDLLWQGSPDYDHRFYNAIRDYVQGQLDANASFSGEGKGPLRFDLTALFYDWCYDAIPTTMRRQIADAFVDDNYGYIYNYSKYWIWSENPNKTWHYLAAIVNDFTTYGDANQYTNDDIVGQLGNYVDHMDQHLFPCWDFFSGGGIDGYAGLRAASQMTVTQFFHDFTNYDPTVESEYINKMPGFWKARLRPDGGWSRMPAKYNTENMGPYYFSWFSKFLRDAESQWIANEFVNVGEIGGNKDGAAFFAWYDNSLPQDPLNVKSTAELEWYDDKLGFFLGRSDYDLFNTDQTITLGFFNGPDTQTHKTQNHFFLAKGDRNLLLDSNQYTGDPSSNYAFYKDAYAHNTVIIWRDGADPGYSQYVNCSYDTGPAPWFGGQLSPNETLGDQMYGVCNGLYGYRGEITDSNFDEFFAYLEGDATEVYKDRANSVVRRVLWLRPGVIFVQDVIVPQGLASANDTVWLGMYHTINQPVINGTINNIVRGNMLGGDMYTLDTDRVTVSVEDAMAQIYVLPSQSQLSKMRLIGGPNSEGKYWQQNHDPTGNATASNKYDTYREDDDISFEFYNPFEGNNYVPFRCPNPPSIYEFNRRNRGDGYMNEYYNANSAGQWTFMMEATPKPDGSPIVYNHVIYVPEAGDPSELDFNVTMVGNVPQVDVSYKDASYHILMGIDGFTYGPNFEVLGACCVPPTNTCEMRSQTACNAVGGTYFGDQTPCVPDPCVALQPDPEPCEPDTVYVPEYITVTDTLYVEIPGEPVPCEKDTLNMELKLQLVVPEGTAVEITPQ